MWKKGEKLKIVRDEGGVRKGEGRERKGEGRGEGSVMQLKKGRRSNEERWGER